MAPTIPHVEPAGCDSSIGFRSDDRAVLIRRPAGARIGLRNAATTEDGGAVVMGYGLRPGEPRRTALLPDPSREDARRDAVLRPRSDGARDAARRQIMRSIVDAASFFDRLACRDARPYGQLDDEGRAVVRAWSRRC